MTPTPEQDLPRSAPAFDYVGLWVDDRAACGATDYYMYLASDGTASAWNQTGRWRAAQDGIHLDMEASEDHNGEVQDAWSQTLKVVVVSADEIILGDHDIRHFRCFEQ